MSWCAPRWRLVREQCAESVLLAIGAACAVFQVLRVVMDVEYRLPLPMGGHVTLAIQPALDGTVLAIAAVSLLLSLVVFGIEPAFQLTRLRDLKEELAAGGNTVGNRRRAASKRCCGGRWRSLPGSSSWRRCS